MNTKYSGGSVVVDIGYTRFCKPLSDEAFNTYFQQIPLTLRSRIRSYKRWQDAHASLFGKLLLSKLATQRKKTAPWFGSIDYNAHGRPFSNFDADDFNISHSGEIVVCAFAEGIRIGIDVEEIKEIELDDFSAIYSPEELHVIRNSADPYVAFFQVWTQKESLIKANGKGLSISLKNVVVNVNGSAEVEGDQWFVKELEIADGYKCHLASSQPFAEPRILSFEF